MFFTADEIVVVILRPIDGFHGGVASLHGGVASLLRARVGVNIWCSCVQNTGKEALHRVSTISAKDKTWLSEGKRYSIQHPLDRAFVLESRTFN